jgi:hypothetical protein
VLVDVAVGEGLLDHREAEGIELREVLGVVEGVVAIGVDREGEVGEGLADGADVSAMPVEFAPNVTKKYNAANCEALGITPPSDYVAIG